MNMKDVAKKIKDEGIEEGKAEGKEKGKLELALTILKDGRYSVEEVAAMTGFSVDFLEKKKKEIEQKYI